MLTREDFLIREDVIFFNHGSFGACPKPVFAEYQRWQLELERQPIEFLLRCREALMGTAIDRIADYLNVPDDEIVFVTNATAGLNIVFRSLPFAPGDEILTTNHEYGAVNRLLEYVSRKTGARIVRNRVRLPYQDDTTFVDDFFKCASDKTKAIVLSHITSPTALIFPVAQICERAREMGILTIIDGAHAPGQLPLDLAAVGADIYSGNFHKWVCAPKGSAFLHVRSERHNLIDPLIVSHGWRDEADFRERHEWQGTRDIAAYLAVPAAIEFQRDHDWDLVRATCHGLAREAQTQLCGRFGLEPLSRRQFVQMATIPIPACDVEAVKERLYVDYRIEIPVGRFEGQCGIRLSLQAYNSADEVDTLIGALESIFA